MIWSWLHRHPRLVDIWIVGVLLALGLGATIRNGHGATGVVLSVAETAPLLFRRRYPVAVVVVVTAAVLVGIAAGVSGFCRYSSGSPSTRLRPFVSKVPSAQSESPRSLQLRSPSSPSVESSSAPVPLASSF